jgi:hypothetical protein
MKVTRSHPFGCTNWCSPSVRPVDTSGGRAVEGVVEERLRTIYQLGEFAGLLYQVKNIGNLYRGLALVCDGVAIITIDWPTTTPM